MVPDRFLGWIEGKVSLFCTNVRKGLIITTEKRPQFYTQLLSGKRWTKSSNEQRIGGDAFIVDGRLF